MKKKKRYNSVLKRVIMPKRQYNAKWKHIVMPFLQKMHQITQFQFS